MSKLTHLCLGTCAFFVLLVGLLWMPSSVSAASEEPYGNSGGKSCPTIHKIALGENLTWIAAEYEVTVEALVEENGIKDANLIVENQALCIPAYRPNSYGGRPTMENGSGNQPYMKPGIGYDPSIFGKQDSGARYQESWQNDSYGKQKDTYYPQGMGYDPYEKGAYKKGGPIYYEYVPNSSEPDDPEEPTIPEEPEIPEDTENGNTP